MGVRVRVRVGSMVRIGARVRVGVSTTATSSLISSVFVLRCS